MIKELLYLLLLLLGIPSGMYLSGVCRDEVKNWKSRLKLMIGLCVGLGVIVFFSGFIYRTSIIIGLMFIIVTCFTIIVKRH